MVTYIIVIIFVVLILTIWTKWWIKYIRINKETKNILDVLHVSMKIVNDFGQFLQTKDEDELVFMAESKLPHSREKIRNAIGCVDYFIEKALNDESLKERFIEHPNSILFENEGAEYFISEKYREVLKSSLAWLDVFVSNELAEKGRKTKIVVDYMKEKGIKPTDNLTAEEWEDFRKVIKEAFKL
jgi:hypothetical protein